MKLTLLRKGLTADLFLIFVSDMERVTLLGACEIPATGEKEKEGEERHRYIGHMTRE